MPPTALPTRMVEIASGIGHDCFWMMLFTTRQMANKLTRSKTSMASKRKSLKGSGVGVGIDDSQRFFCGVSFRMTFLKPWEICTNGQTWFSPRGIISGRETKKNTPKLWQCQNILIDQRSMAWWWGDLRTFFRGYSRLPGGFCGENPHRDSV